MEIKPYELPLEAIRRCGEAVLWVTERLVPPQPSIESKAANITILSTGEPDERIAA